MSISTQPASNRSTHCASVCSKTWRCAAFEPIRNATTSASSKALPRFLGAPPDTATAEDVRRFQVHQRESGMQPQSINNSVSGLRFFFTVTLNRPDLSLRLVLVRFPRKLPDVLSVEEVGRLQFFGAQAELNERRGFLRRIAPLRKQRWVVYAKPPFSGPTAVLADLSRYTHRVAFSNRRLIAMDEDDITFRYKDYRRSGTERQRVMTLAPDEFIRRFLIHVLPKGFHRIRHYTNGGSF